MYEDTMQLFNLFFVSKLKHGADYTLVSIKNQEYAIGHNIK